MSKAKSGSDSYETSINVLDVFNEAMDKYRDKRVASRVSLMDKQTACFRFGVVSPVQLTNVFRMCV